MYGFSITLDALSAMVTGDVQQDVRVQELWAAGVKYESIKNGDDLRFFNELLLSAKKNLKCRHRKGHIRLNGAEYRT